MQEAIDDLEKAFPGSKCMIREDGQGGAFVILEPISLYGRFEAHTTWLGFKIPFQYPHADIYPLFIGSEIPVTSGQGIQTGQSFEERQAIQLSRRSKNPAQDGYRKAAVKVGMVLDWLCEAAA